jgi:DNA-binding SARP family transcriptional activator
MPQTVFGTGPNSKQDEAERAEAPLTPKTHVRMLGSPCVEWAGCTLAFPRRQVRAVLYRLATPLAPLPLQYLCSLFWRDIPERSARRNLSHVLTRLHGLLSAPEVLLCLNDSIALDPWRTWKVR